MKECYIIIEGCVHDGFGIKETVYTDPNEAIKDVLFRVNEANAETKKAFQSKCHNLKKDKDSDNYLVSYSNGSYFIAAVKRNLK